MSELVETPEVAVADTPLAAQLAAASPALELEMHRGAQTPLQFAGIPAEMEALLRSAGVFDLGFRTFLRATGKDRVRWMNGMITQTVKGLAAGQTGYTLVLSPQGRIQGDADLYVHDEELVLETDRFQAERLLTTLRRYIIMDDVKLEALDASSTAIGVAGPRAGEILEKLGVVGPEPGTFQAVNLAGIAVELVGAYSPVVQRFEIHVAAEHVLTLWNALIEAGATACGMDALEDLRVLEGVPAFGVDFHDKHLPQEANVPRALCFTKGCYIGQETVERIRARATLHRGLRHLELLGAPPELGPGEKVELRSGVVGAGELTSVAAIDVPGFAKIVALGVVRLEALQGTEPIRYGGGTVIALDEPPIPQPL
ncbi:MAG: folate-binding protein [Acidobacteriaceae bacterium]